MDKRFIDAINADDFVTVRDMLKNRLLMDHDVNGGMFDVCPAFPAMQDTRVVVW